jgi:hypothetical protein
MRPLQQTDPVKNVSKIEVGVAAVSHRLVKKGWECSTPQ